MLSSSMVNVKTSHRPIISFRPIRPSDLEVLEKLHGDLFPIRYESEFFQNVVNGRDIVSWGAVDCNRPNGQSDELIGFVTARTIMAKESEVEDLIRFDPSMPDQTLVYILTLGVLEPYRNLGVASSLIREVIKYASCIPTCQAVYLHVISYNNPAIYLYQKMSFQCVRRLHSFYLINGQHYDAYLFIYYVNRGRSPCSPLEVLTLLVTYAKSGFKSMTAKLWKHEERKTPKWPKTKESGCLLPTTQNKRTHN
ncbi:PREDICTED: histone acetyltransferase MCC1 [Ipomoea nil]|uniref:histone acetyltransferase MCC1 n=1 Tax=Ipomoea nil TaxID=35883 RepID=UPI0009014D36|nr:PREDICTED: histone acetyltransferase MCC1 [Ipomoea nil]XP_019184233.1 PREDICTED: histone acetyltransferase MCC1 [Ipomoea nil]XP_019184234.1 PREDICTED: histone acetyltransferase MCC1 [Ipomoea nil]XP_019184235.1 PREDICTED: histone acetyltransferase MCC1 [Ipomoea nil]